MKRSKKLALNRETLRHLEAQDLATATGGVSHLCTSDSRASCPEATCGRTTGTAGDSIVMCTSVM